MKREKSGEKQGVIRVSIEFKDVEELTRFFKPLMAEGKETPAKISAGKEAPGKTYVRRSEPRGFMSGKIKEVLEKSPGLLPEEIERLLPKEIISEHKPGYVGTVLWRMTKKRKVWRKPEGNTFRYWAKKPAIDNKVVYTGNLPRELEEAAQLMLEEKKGEGATLSEIVSLVNRKTLERHSPQYPSVHMSDLKKRGIVKAVLERVELGQGRTGKTRFNRYYLPQYAPNQQQ